MTIQQVSSTLSTVNTSLRTAAPTIVASGVTAAVGDTIVVKATTGLAAHVPSSVAVSGTAAAITWTSRRTQNPANACPQTIWTGKVVAAVTNRTITVTCSIGSSSTTYGLFVWARFTGVSSTRAPDVAGYATPLTASPYAANLTDADVGMYITWLAADYSGVRVTNVAAYPGDTLDNTYINPTAGTLCAFSGGHLVTSSTAKNAGYTATGTGTSVTMSFLWMQPTPAISTLSSDFTSMPAFLDDNFGTVAIVNGQASLAVTNAYSGIQTTADFDGRGSSAFAKITPNHPRTGSYETLYYWWIDENNFVAFYVSGATFQGQVRKAGVNTFVALNGDVYDPTAHAYWRIREANGTVYFDASPDGATWTNLGSLAHTLNLGAVVWEVASGYYETEAAVPATLVDNLNIAGATPVAHTRTVSDTIGVQDPGATASVNPTISSLTSDFATLPPFFDGNFGGVSIVDAQGVVPTVGTYAAFATAGRYSAINDVVYVRVVTPSGTGGTRQNSLKLEVDATNSVEMMLDGGVFHGRVTRGGVVTDISLNGGTYSPTPHAYWRVREAGGTVYFDTSTNATTWANLGSAIHGLDLSAVRLLLQAGFYGTETVTPPPAVYDNLNSTAPTPISYAQTVTDPAAVADAASRTVAGGRTVADAPGVVDAVGVAAVTDRAITDAAGITDAAQTAKTGDGTITDPVGVTDTVANVGAYVQESADALGVADNLSWLGGASRELTDAMDIADVEGTTAEQVYRQDVTDALGVVDDQSQLIGNDLGLLDTFGATDSIDAAADYAPELTDTAGVADTVVRAGSYDHQLDDAAGVTDALQAERRTDATRTDAFGVSDSVSAVAQHAAVLVDPVGTTDTTSRTAPTTRGITEPVGVVDTIGVQGRQKITAPADVAVEIDTATELRPTATMPVPVAVETNSAIAPRPTASKDTPLAVENDTVSTPRPTGSYPTQGAADFELAFTPVVLVDDGEFGVAINDADRTPIFRLKADWNRNGLYDHPLSDLTSLVTEVSVDRTLNGTLPAEIGLVEGYSTAALSVTLEGKWWGDPEARMDVVDVFAPYRPDSPLYGAPMLRTPIYLDTGFIANDGPRFDRRFTGTVSNINPSSAARSVQLGALDPAALLRGTVTTSGTGLYGEILARRGPDAYRSRINSQWLIDRALRANGIFSSPPPRANAILSVTGHGSMIPEIGWGGAPEEYYPTYRGEMWQPGPFGGAIAPFNGGNGRWWLTEQLTAASGTGFGLSCWMLMGGSRNIDDHMFTMDLTPDSTWFFRFGTDSTSRPWVALFRAGQNEIRCTAAGYTRPTTSTWQFVGVHVTFAATTMTARFRVNGQDYTSTANIGSRSTNWRPGVLMEYEWRRSFTNFQIWKSTTPPTAPWQGEDKNFIPQADLDPGSNELTGIPALLEMDAWELIKAVTDAEGSTFQFTEEGRPQFRTLKGDQWYGRTKAVKESITADHNLSDLVSTIDESTIRNIINIKTKTQVIGDWADYFQAATPDQFDTPPGTSVFDVEIDPNVYDVPETRDAYGVRPDLPSAFPNASFIFFTVEDTWGKLKNDHRTKDRIRLFQVYADDPVAIPFGQEPPTYIRVERPSATIMRLYITNYGSRTVRFATPTTYDDAGYARPGEPALLIPARRIEQGPEQVVTYTDNGSVNVYGPSSFDVGGSDETWRQTSAGFVQLATTVLATTANPVPVLDAVDVPHDPRRALGDRIILADPDGLGEVITSIVGITSAYSSSGAKDRVTVRPLAPPGVGLLDDASHGLLDVNLVLGP